MTSTEATEGKARRWASTMVSVAVFVGLIVSTIQRDEVLLLFFGFLYIGRFISAPEGRR